MGEFKKIPFLDRFKITCSLILPVLPLWVASRFTWNSAYWFLVIIAVTGVVNGVLTVAGKPLKDPPNRFWAVLVLSTAFAMLVFLLF